MYRDDRDYHAHDETAFPCFCRRANQTMRDYVALMAWSVETGELTVREAAIRMNLDGVPIDVTRRVLSKARRKPN